MTERHDLPAACDNCSTALIGGYCHVCGQHAHNPLRHFSHAMEEVFESFWHLDGRIFRTLRDLFVPGRVASGYLAGHRVRYIAPLRLFIILSVITFFVGRLTLHFDPGANMSVDTGAPQSGLVIGDSSLDDSGISRAKTVGDVLRMRAEALKDLTGASKSPDAGWFLSNIRGFATTQIDEQSRKRMRELGATPEQLRLLDRPVDAATSAAIAAPTRATRTPKPVGAGAANATEDGVLARWFRHKVERLQQNAELVQQRPDEFVKLVLGAVPGALFMLVPLFALCLKLLYIRSGRGYLEHLVVAIYSHAFMLTALLAVFLLVGLQSVPGLPVWASGTAALVASLTLGVLVPLYLLWMQKRVYAQGWAKTLIKYMMLGLIYSFLLGLAVVYAVLAGLSS